MGRADSAQQRLALLELLLLWEGFLNRSRIADLLGLGGIRSSQLIQEFRDAHPRWVEWNTKSRSYHATSAAYARTTTATKTRDRAESLAKYLNLVGLPYVAGDAVNVAPVCAAFPDLNTPEPHVFAALSQAIRSCTAVEITYRSLKEPAPHQRIISPHHLVRAGRRWHVRAYCATHHEFRDYALGRMIDVNAAGLPRERSEDDDVAWNARVPVRLIAHPDLSRSQQEVIRFEYFDKASSRVVMCRGALVGYFVQDTRAAIDASKQCPPDYQLAVSNIAEVKRWLFPA